MGAGQTGFVRRQGCMTTAAKGDGIVTSSNREAMEMRLSALLAATALSLAGPTIAAGSALSDLAATLQPGTWAELQTGNIDSALSDTRTGGVGHILPYAEGIRWDPVSKKAYYIGSDDPGDGRRFVVYSEATNSWSVLPDPWSGTGVAHEYDLTDIDVTNRVIYTVLPDGFVGKQYNINTGTFSDMPSFPSMSYSCCEAAVHFPEAGGLLLLNKGTFYRLSDSSHSWSEFADGPTTSYHSVAEYNPTHKVVIFGGGNDTSRAFGKVASNGQVTALRTPPIDLESPRVEITTDPATGLYLVLEYGRRFYTYNVQTDTWTAQQTGSIPTAIWATEPDPGQLNTLATPIPEYGVIMYTTCMYDCTVFLYKHADRPTAPPSAPTGVNVQ